MVHSDFEFSRYIASRKKHFNEFGDIFSSEVVRGSTNDYFAELYESGNVLDIGAGAQKPYLEAIEHRLDTGKYYTLDTDPGGTFDFSDVQDIPQKLKFSHVMANQVFEHLTIEESLEVAQQVSKHLETGAHFVITVPNPSHPTRFKSCITHKTWWSHSSLHYLFDESGLQVTKIGRYSKVHPESFPEKLVAKVMQRVYRVDWCDSIFVVATKE